MKKIWALFALSLFLSPHAFANSGDFNGGVAIGSSYAGTVAAPANGAIVQGPVGIGSTSPAATLDVNGGVRMGNDADACGGGNEGTQRYNGTPHAYEYCNGN